MENNTLYSIPLTSEDVNLITFALRRLSETTGLATIRDDSKNLIGYVEREHAQRRIENGEVIKSAVDAVNKANVEKFNRVTRCERCGDVLDESKIVWMELSQTDGKYYDRLPDEHVSQGAFPFGAQCAKKANQPL